MIIGITLMVLGIAGIITVPVLAVQEVIKTVTPRLQWRYSDEDSWN